MAKMTLSGSQTQKSISRFIFEAKECAHQELGFAAMQVIFSVILAVSEAVNPNLHRGDERLLKAFVPEMTDKTSWLIAPSGILPDNDIAELLNQVRNALAHQLSLPTNVYLVNTRADAEEFSKKHPTRLFISTGEFVSAVESTVHQLVKSHPQAIWDPHPRHPRGPADRLIEFLTTMKTGSASGFSDK